MPVYKSPGVDLRSKYYKYIKISFIITLLLIIAAFKFSPFNEASKEIKKTEPEIINIEQITQTKHDPTPPELPKPLQPIISTSDEIIDIEFEATDDFDKEVTELPVPVKGRIIEEEEKLTYYWVEEMPEIIGDLQALQSKIHYTEITRRAGIEGQVVVAIVIDKEGNVIDAEVIKSLSDDLDEITLNAVREIKFKPGKQRGKPVKVKMYIPVKFKLK